jgi:hypothetical protein
VSGSLDTQRVVHVVDEGIEHLVGLLRLVLEVLQDRLTALGGDDIDRHGVLLAESP